MSAFPAVLTVQIRVSVRPARECKTEQELDNYHSATALSDILTVVNLTVQNVHYYVPLALQTNPVNNVSVHNL